MAAATPAYADSVLDYDRLEEIVQESAVAYRTASPFPHIVIDELLSAATVDFLLARMPAVKPQAQQGGASYLQMEDGELAQAGKQWISRELSVDVAFRRIYWELNAGPFVRFLQRLTGVPRLLPDPYLLGGGIHQTLPGGYLQVHADFNQHPDLRLQRRLNVLIYLNQDWSEDWGGKLELWSGDMQRCEETIAPLAGRCVIFNTTSTSFHGHPQPLACPAGQTRKSLALYYYSMPDEGGREHATLWQKPAP
jgi:hypothetical protein